MEASTTPAPKGRSPWDCCSHVSEWCSSSGRGSCAEMAVAPVSLRGGDCVMDSGTNMEEGSEETWITNRKDGAEGLIYIGRKERKERNFIRFSCKIVEKMNMNGFLYRRRRSRGDQSYNKVYTIMKKQ